MFAGQTSTDSRGGEQALHRLGDRPAARRRRRELAFTFQGERIEKNVRDLAGPFRRPLVTELDVR